MNANAGGMGHAGAVLVRALHAAFIAWMVWAPLYGSRETLKMHAIVCPFLMLHWATNSDGCALTVLESRLRGVSPTRSFVHSVVAPVYVIDDATVKRTVWLATLGLWSVSLWKLYSRHETTRRLPLVAASHS